MKKRYSAILGNLSNTCDRFLSSGYKDQPTKEESWIDSYGMENFGKLIRDGLAVNILHEFRKIIK